MRAFRPRISEAPAQTGELIQRMRPHQKARAELAHPVCGVSLTSRTADPIRQTAAHREVADAKVQIDVKADRRRGASAIGPLDHGEYRVVATVIWLPSRQASRAGRGQPSCSPDQPPSKIEVSSSRTSRSFSFGRRTISSSRARRLGRHECGPIGIEICQAGSFMSE